jgi:hypothetical protein
VCTRNRRATDRPTTSTLGAVPAAELRKVRFCSEFYKLFQHVNLENSWVQEERDEETLVLKVSEFQTHSFKQNRLSSQRGNIFCAAKRHAINVHRTSRREASRHIGVQRKQLPRYKYS